MTQGESRRRRRPPTPRRVLGSSRVDGRTAHAATTQVTGREREIFNKKRHGFKGENWGASVAHPCALGVCLPLPISLRSLSRAPQSILAATFMLLRTSRSSHSATHSTLCTLVVLSPAAPSSIEIDVIYFFTTLNALPIIMVATEKDLQALGAAPLLFKM